MLRIKLRRVLSKKKTSSVKLFSSLEHFSALQGGSILGRSLIVRSRVWTKNWAPCVSCLRYLSLSKMAWFQHLIISICESGQSFTFFLLSGDNPVFMIGRCLMRIGVFFVGFQRMKILNRLIAKSDIKHSPNTTLLLLRIENHNVAFTVFYCFCI